MIHYTFVTCVPLLHGAFCLYNGGFTAAFTCFLFIPCWSISARQRRSAKSCGRGNKRWEGSCVMFYCENCYLLNEENTCAFCGSRLTRGRKWTITASSAANAPRGRDVSRHSQGTTISPVIIRQWSPRTAAYTGEVGTRTDFFVPYSELDHARQLEQALMDSSFEQPD